MIQTRNANGTVHDQENQAGKQMIQTQNANGTQSLEDTLEVDDLDLPTSEFIKWYPSAWNKRQKKKEARAANLQAAQCAEQIEKSRLLSDKLWRQMHGPDVFRIAPPPVRAGKRSAKPFCEFAET